MAEMSLKCVKIEPCVVKINVFCDDLKRNSRWFHLSKNQVYSIMILKMNDK